jgi:hypothetical protein
MEMTVADLRNALLGMPQDWPIGDYDGLLAIGVEKSSYTGEDGNEVNYVAIEMSDE